MLLLTTILRKYSIFSRSAESISAILTETMSNISPAIGNEILPVYKKSVAILNIVLDQLQTAVEGKFICT